MKIKEFKERLTGAILTERERCARVAESYYEWHKHDTPEWCDGDPAVDIAARIRSAKPPSYRVFRPETIAKQPELLKQDIIVAGGITAERSVVTREHL